MLSWTNAFSDKMNGDIKNGSIMFTLAVLRQNGRILCLSLVHILNVPRAETDRQTDWQKDTFYVCRDKIQISNHCFFELNCSFEHFILGPKKNNFHQFTTIYNFIFKRRLFEQNFIFEQMYFRTKIFAPSVIRSGSVSFIVNGFRYLDVFQVKS